MNELEARDFIPGLSEQFTFKELKSAFRARSFVVHPDHGGTDDEFRFLQEAYEFLQTKAVHELGQEVHELQTIDGTPLSELGKGLPITVSAKECDICEGRGWKAFSSFYKEVECPECQGEGTFWLPCKKCGGTGAYKYPKGDRKGKCYLCGGNGRFYPKYKPRGIPKMFKYMNWVRDLDAKWVKLPNGQDRKVNRCKKCSGEGQVRVEDDKRLSYVKCSKCEGCGEEQIFNPVLPRGYIVGGIKE